MTKDTRIRCPHCGMRTWSTDYTAFMADHDRADGKRCRKAAAQHVHATAVRVLGDLAKER